MSGFSVNRTILGSGYTVSTVFLDTTLRSEERHCVRTFHLVTAMAKHDEIVEKVKSKEIQ